MIVPEVAVIVAVPAATLVAKPRATHRCHGSRGRRPRGGAGQVLGRAVAVRSRCGELLGVTGSH